MTLVNIVRINLRIKKFLINNHTGNKLIIYFHFILHNFVKRCMKKSCNYCGHRNKKIKKKPKKQCNTPGGT